MPKVWATQTSSKSVCCLRGISLCNWLQSFPYGFLMKIKDRYSKDKLFTLILEKPTDYKGFTVDDHLVLYTNPKGNKVVCVPHNHKLIVWILNQVHTILGHFGGQCTDEYIQCWYWWPSIGCKVWDYCHTCEVCQCVKGNKRPQGKLHPPMIPTKPWDLIGMDFIGPFPEANGFNYLWVIICRMTSMVYLILVYTKMKASELSWIYRCEIVHLHRLPSSIVSDHDSKFTLKCWWELHKILGTKLLMSMLFHP